jgi:hypothetical protein
MFHILSPSNEVPESGTEEIKKMGGMFQGCVRVLYIH